MCPEDSGNGCEDSVCPDGGSGSCDSVCPDGGSGSCNSVCPDGGSGSCNSVCPDGGSGSCDSVCPDGGSGGCDSVCPDEDDDSGSGDWVCNDDDLGSGDRVCPDDGSCGPVCDNNGDKGWLSAEDGTADGVPGCAKFPSKFSIIETPFLSTTIRCAEAMPTRALKRNTKLNTIDVARQR